jgi:hypothetical protein
MCSNPRFSPLPFFVGSLLLLLVMTPGQSRADEGLPPAGLFARTNLVAWCIVPFDARKRGPEERAVMLSRLGIRRMAYDWREEHIPTFDAEVAACQRHGIELTAGNHDDVQRNGVEARSNSTWTEPPRSLLHRSD